MPKYWIVLTIILLCVASRAGFASDTAVRQVEIKSGWGGLGTAQNTDLVIRREGDGYRLGRKRISAETMNALVAALRENEVSKPDATNLGITQEWLIANAEKAAVKDNVAFAIAQPDQKNFYLKSFTDPTFIKKVLPSLFNYTKFDDYPSARVSVTFEDGSTLVASTGSWYLMMLPWEIQRDGKTITTYNAHISRSLATLMPKKATNHDRLEGDAMDSELAQSVMRFIENDWKLLGAEHKAASAISKLRTKYSVHMADVNPYHDVAFGVAWDKGVPHEENLHATLTRQSFPPHFYDTVILLYKDGLVYGTDDFIKNAKQYEELALSVPWLSARLHANYPHWGISLLWVHDKPFSDKALKEFSADMHAIGKDALAEEVRKVQDSVALLNVGYGDYWIVLPDKRMVLWRYESVIGLMGFKQSEISAHRCADYQGVTGGCVGAVVSPDGQLVK